MLAETGVALAPVRSDLAHHVPKMQHRPGAARHTPHADAALAFVRGKQAEAMTLRDKPTVRKPDLKRADNLLPFPIEGGELTGKPFRAAGKERDQLRTLPQLLRRHGAELPMRIKEKIIAITRAQGGDGTGFEFRLRAPAVPSAGRRRLRLALPFLSLALRVGEIYQLAVRHSVAPAPWRAPESTKIGGGGGKSRRMSRSIATPCAKSRHAMPPPKRRK